LMKHCTKDYIFFIDADELISDLLQYLPEILLLNSGVELIHVPRINTVKNLTQEHIDKWGWKLNENEWVNYPDYQSRIVKNSNHIKWENKVHERLVGAKSYTFLPKGYDLIHNKTIERQEKQNELYSNIGGSTSV
jgi:glycosyltransferase involved in cell wall biosynthesis